MRIVKRIVAIVLIVVAALVVIVAVAGVVLVRRTFPQERGTIQVTGLDNQVEVYRDEWGIPTIYAHTAHDLFFAQGYVHAQDRLWQMEFSRRVAPGRLSEVLGDAALENDRYLRTLGMGRAAQAEAERLDPEARAALEAYSAGVNAYLAEGHPLPLEFTLLGFQPEPWTPADSIGWGKVMAMFLGNNEEAERLRVDLISQVGEERMRQLTPSYPGDAPLIVSQEIDYDTLSTKTLDRAEALRDWLGFAGPDGGSNNWVVSGQRSTTGRPLLANDPHLGIQMPSIWYELGLQCVELSAECSYQAVGASFPGTPGVVIGHNPWIAWGVTTLPADVQDLYVEKVNPDNPNQVEYQGQWEEMQVIREEIKVKGQETPEVVEVRLTRHGPIMNDVIDGLSQVLALRWTALGETPLLPSVLAMDQARNWDEFRAALRTWSIAGQNFVYADVEGNIGYQSTMWVPVRAKGDGSMPVPGWTGEYEWTGYIPYEEMPYAYNPAEGTLMSANNKVVGDDYPYLLTNDWDNGYRARRLTELLTAKQVFSPEDFEAMQADDLVIPAREIVPYLAGLTSADEQVQGAIDRLSGWDYHCGLDSVGCAVFQAAFVNLLRGTFGDELGEDLTDQYISSEWAEPVLIGLLADPASAWFDDVTTPDRTESRDEALLRAVEQATADLTAQLGSKVDGWEWGKLHVAVFDHTMGGVKPLNLIFNKSTQASGCGAAVNATGFSPAEPFEVLSVPSYRQIVDLAEWAGSRSMHTTGQSGLPFHRHYADMMTSWRDIGYHPMLWTAAEVQAHAQAKLVLEP
jgi:penicillin amidase